MGILAPPRLECGWYLTNETRLVRILSLTDTEALCENVASPGRDALTFKVATLLGSNWRRVHPQASA